MLVSEFDYELPPELIAQQPAAQRGASRLLYLDAASGELKDLAFSDLPGLAGPEDLLVLNDTKVIRARLHGRKSTGGRIEVFVERIEGTHEALALARTSHALHPGYQLTLGDGAGVEVLGREGDLYRLRFEEAVTAVLERCAEVPLPPYIRHAPTAEDVARYQTVYAAKPGAVAAPTAGLHFDQAMLDRIAARGAGIARVTLHVGAGTFQPVRSDVVEQHRMHSERYEIPETTLAALAGRRVLAVGTTSLRALEAAAVSGAASGETDLFITPGFRFRTVRRLLTNFHLPRSTLLMLVSAFAGTENIRRAYSHAIEQRYRFLSYGDAMLIDGPA
ncbi:MAG: tRNA preQ1(34) S-adenosylmethionine ribosyltransferase-isomerase QueA [Proteobacteria bacterium]|nr:tRNA preQ1(34) S-adenosylmethionine ribosyltransferase-isomerase QueA [Pseudomonadota bacterium]MDA0982681.1 tRNA preQ1(34) S-adenosylmethionine ribosyltransferase-isomerase QueA [Pseudomonadota bacterium]